MARKTVTFGSVAEGYLALLGDRGVDYLFGNAGTDFAPIIEGLSKAAVGEFTAPAPLTVPHENVAVAMAHGYYLATGRPQAVMLHVGVGTANGVCGIMNAARENVPILFTAGRTPITEGSLPGARNLFIHWAQEMFDQAGMVREMVKWDYELRNADQLETVVDRAIAVAMSPPRGPIYLSLPREVLAAPLGEISFDSPTRQGAATASAADPNAIAQAASWIANANNPVIVTASYGRHADDVAALAELAERSAIPVVCYRPRYMCLGADHPMHMGYESGKLIKDADVILVIDCDVPWIPALHKVNPDARVIQLAVDPLFANYPVRGFPCDLAIAADAGPALVQLADALDEGAKKASARIEKSRKRARDARAEAAEARAQRIGAAGNGAPMDTVWVAHCLDQVRGAADIVVSESQLPIAHLSLTEPGTYFGTSPAGGLGWGVGAALGVKLGAPARRVFSVVGDGAYMFGNPTPAHYVGAANELPVLTVILNNRMWGSVRKATLGLYPDGAAAKLNRAPLTTLDPAPDYEKIVEASGGYGEKVEAACDLPGAFERALKAVEVDKRQAVLNVMTSYDDSQALADSRR